MAYQQRHMERARKVVADFSPDLVPDKLASLIAIALSEAEVELVARMMEVTDAMAEAGTKTCDQLCPNGGLYQGDVLRAMLQAFARENGIPIANEGSSDSRSEPCSGGVDNPIPTKPESP